MILESKEELVAQIQADWELLLRADADLERAARIVMDIHKDFRGYMKSRHDKTAVRGQHGVDATGRVGARAEAEASSLPGLSDAGDEQVLRTGRDTSGKRIVRPASESRGR